MPELLQECEKLPEEMCKLLEKENIIERSGNKFYKGKNYDKWIKIANKVYGVICRTINDLINKAYLGKDDVFEPKAFYDKLVKEFPKESLGRILTEGLALQAMNEFKGSKKEQMYARNLLLSIYFGCDDPINTYHLFREIEFRIEQPGYA